METNKNVKDSFNKILYQNCWNKYRETHILLGYISNFLFLFDLLSENHIYTQDYKYKILSAIFSMLISIDCELNFTFVNDKFDFMSTLREKNISLEAVLNHKKHDLSIDQLEQLEFYNKLDILFKYLVHFFDQMLKNSPSKWESFIKLIIKIFDNVLIFSHNTIAIQFFWFYFISLNTVFLY